MSQNRGEEEIEDLTAKFQNRQVETTGSSSDFGEKPKSSSNFVSNTMLNNILEGQDKFNKQILETLRIMRNEMKEGMNQISKEMRDLKEKQEEDTKSVLDRISAVQEAVNKLEEKQALVKSEVVCSSPQTLRTDTIKNEHGKAQKKLEVGRVLEQSDNQEVVSSDDSDDDNVSDEYVSDEDEYEEEESDDEEPSEQQIIVPSNNINFDRENIGNNVAPYTINFVVNLYSSGKKFTFQFSSSDHVRDLNSKIYEVSNIPYELQQITFEGKVCERWYKLQDLGFPPSGYVLINLHCKAEMSATHVIPVTPRLLRIIVKTLTGKHVHVEIMSTQFFFDLKRKIRDKEGIPCDQQRLIFACKLMDDEEQIGEYVKEDGSFVHLILRLRGGSK